MWSKLPLITVSRAVKSRQGNNDTLILDLRDTKMANLCFKEEEKKF